MIRIKVTSAELLAAIKKKSPKWLENAAEKKITALKAGRVEGRKGLWGEVKEVFYQLQEAKCVYCESPLPRVDPASVEKVAVDFDIDHYRPKNRVTPWPTPKALRRRPSVAEYRNSVAVGAPAGYVRLAFDPLNYVAACKVCNSSYKGDCFPIAGLPDTVSEDWTTLFANEKPLLLFPFGENGDDPANYLAFQGPTIQPRPVDGYERLRARTVIDFFELDTREGLLWLRCFLIQALWDQLRDRESGDPEKRAKAGAYLETFRKTYGFPQTACGRAFLDLYEKDRHLAERWREAACEYLTSRDPLVLKAHASKP
jgi:hypothetical protein